MSQIEFRCPSCGRVLFVPATAAGKGGTCPHCAAHATVPSTHASEGTAKASSRTDSKRARPRTPLVSGKTTTTDEDNRSAKELLSDFIQPDSVEAPETIIERLMTMPDEAAREVSHRITGFSDANRRVWQRKTGKFNTRGLVRLADLARRFGVKDENTIEHLAVLVSRDLDYDDPEQVEAARSCQETIDHLIRLDAPRSIRSTFAGALKCEICGVPHGVPEWPLHGDLTPFYCERERGRAGYAVAVTCPKRNKTWYVVWDDFPGPIGPVFGATTRTP